MSQLLRAVLVSVAALALGVAGSATGDPTTRVHLLRCKGLVKGAPWTEAIQESVGPRIVRGSTYAVWIGSFGPPCALAKSKTAQLSRLGTPRALRRASFSRLQCRIAAVLCVRQIGLGAAPDGRGWLLDDRQPTLGPLLLLAAAQVARITGDREAATSPSSGRK